MEKKTKRKTEGRVRRFYEKRFGDDIFFMSGALTPCLQKRLTDNKKA